MIALVCIIALSIQGSVSVVQNLNRFLDENPNSMVLKCNFHDCNKNFITDATAYNATKLVCGIMYCDVTPNDCSLLAYPEILFYSSKTLVYKTVADIEFNDLLDKVARLNSLTDEGFGKNDKTKIAVVNQSEETIRKLAFLPFTELVDFTPKPIIFFGNHSGPKEIINMTSTYSATIDRVYTCILLTKSSQCPAVTSRFIYLSSSKIVVVYRPLSKKLFVTYSPDVSIIREKAMPPIYSYPYPDESLTHINQDVMIFSYDNPIKSAKYIEEVYSWAKNVFN